MTERILRHITAVVVLFVLLLLPPATSFAKEPADVNIRVLTWRGQTRAEAGFIDALEDAGYNPVISHADAGQSLKTLMKNLDETPDGLYDIVYTFGTTVTSSTIKKIRKTPVIFNIVAHPVKDGIVSSMAGSGTNVTGVTHLYPVKKQLEVFSGIINYQSLGVLYHAREKNSVTTVSLLRGLSKEMNFRLVEAKLEKGSSGLDRALEKLVKSGVDAVYLPPDSMVISLGAEVLKRLNEAGTPTMVSTESLVAEHGALFGASASYYEAGRLAAEKCISVLKGSSPGKEPVARAEPEYFINLKTARMLGLTIPEDIMEKAATAVQ